MFLLLPLVSQIHVHIDPVLFLNHAFHPLLYILPICPAAQPLRCTRALCRSFF
jgi:hypothetical protein